MEWEGGRMEGAEGGRGDIDGKKERRENGGWTKLSMLELTGLNAI